MSLFSQTIALRPEGAGRFFSHVRAEWNGPVSPNGGVLAAMMLAAGQAELARAQPGLAGSLPPARTIAAQFLEAPSAGEVELAVEVLRTGKRVAACEVRLSQEGRLAVQASVVFSAARADLLDLRRSMPAVPPPDRARVLGRVLADAPPIFGALELQPTFGGIPFSGAEEAVVGGWTAMRGDPGPVDSARLVALSDVWFPAIFPRLETFAGVPTLQLTVHLRSSEPVPWPVLGRFRSRHLAEGHLEEQGELWSADGRLLAESTQLALLVAPR